MAVRLDEAGAHDFLIVDQSGDFGGVWYWNRYPGVRCDIESYIYMPLLEEVGTMPTEKYAGGPEMLEHARAIGRHDDLYSRALLGTTVTEVAWSEERSRWAVSTDRGDLLHARFVLIGTGPLNRPKLPGIKGIESFRGKTFHSSRWDYRVTGGDWNGNLDKLADKRVAVIGTGGPVSRSPRSPPRPSSGGPTSWPGCTSTARVTTRNGPRATTTTKASSTTRDRS